MAFVYPKTLTVGTRTWQRADSYVNPTAGNQVMYKLTPPPTGKSAYDHISIIVGKEDRPQDNEIHVTMKCTPPFVPNGTATVKIGNTDYQKSLLVFYWDFDVTYDPVGLKLSTKYTFNAGRPAKVLANSSALASSATASMVQVSTRDDLKDLRKNTEEVKAPVTYATEFWSDLISVQEPT
jgi:hypothetical protein